MIRHRVQWLDLLPVTLAFILPACASGPPRGPSPAQIAGMEATTILVSPFNIVNPLPPELEGATRIVSTTLAEHLEANGKTVHQIAYRAGKDLWMASRKEVRDSGSRRTFENAAKVYARKLGEQVEYDVVIVPSVFVQNAKKGHSRTIRWDDTEQTLEYRGDSRAVTIASIYVKAASLFVYVLDREGDTLHSKQVGLELIQHMRFGAERGSGLSRRQDREAQLINDWQLVDDVPPIQDENRVRLGVGRALFPFLPEESPATIAVTPEAESGAK
jgi:hypothetical protein